MTKEELAELGRRARPGGFVAGDFLLGRLLHDRWLLLEHVRASIHEECRPPARACTDCAHHLDAISFAVDAPEAPKDLNPDPPVEPTP